MKWIGLLTLFLLALGCSQSPKKQTLEGELQVVTQDSFQHGGLQSTERYFLITDKEKLEVKFENPNNVHIISGSKVRMEGFRSAKVDKTVPGLGADAILNVSDNSTTVLESEPSKVLSSKSTPLSSTAALSPTSVSGEQKVLTLLINFPDEPSEPFTKEEANDFVYNTVSNAYAKNSFGIIPKFSGQAYGWLTLPCLKNNCNPVPDAITAAEAAGIDLTPYQHLVILAANSSCIGFGGPATAPDYPNLTTGTVVWGDCRPVDESWMIAHEMAHGFGLVHAHALLCTRDYVNYPVPYAPVGPCEYKEYGDPMDVMGHGAEGIFFNGFEREFLGWLTVPEITTSTTLDIGLLDSNTELPKEVKIKSRYGDQTYTYYLEYTIGIHHNGYILGTPGVYIRVVPDDPRHLYRDRTGSSALDMTPDYGMDVWDGQLPVGKSFHDPGSKFTVTTQSFTPTSVTVQVQFHSPDTTAPTVSITSPANGASVSGASLDVSANASDDLGLASVMFTIDGFPVVPEIGAPPYNQTLDISNISPGSHTLLAKARDGAGNLNTSSIQINITNPLPVNDTTPPAVQLIHSPQWPSTAQQVTLTAAATDMNGVAQIDIYVVEKLSYKIVKTCYSINFCTYTGGPYFKEGRPLEIGIMVTDASSNANRATKYFSDIEIVSPGFPLLTFDSLTNGSVVSGVVPIAATASKRVNPIYGFELLKDGTSVTKSYSGTLNYIWNTTVENEGRHKIEIYLYDAYNNYSSNTIFVYVDNKHNATLPDPNKSDYKNRSIILTGTMMGAPDPLGSYWMIARDANSNPIPNLRVDLDLNACRYANLCGNTVGLHCWDTFDPLYAYHRIVTTLTDANGLAQFYIPGGLVSPSSGMHGEPCAVLRAGAVDFPSKLPVSVLDLDGGSPIGANDLGIYLTDFGTGRYMPRSDFDGSGGIGANDLSLWLTYWGGGAINACPVAMCTP